MPEDASFCPNCGAPAEVEAKFKPEVGETTLRYLVIGLIGALLSVMISAFSGVELYFIPSFVSSILIIYVYRINDFKESLIVTFTVYLFAEGISAGFVLGYSYAFNIPYEFSLSPKIWEVILYSFNPISAFIAAYIGVRISPKRRELVLVPQKREEGPGGVIYNL